MYQNVLRRRKVTQMDKMREYMATLKLEKPISSHKTLNKPILIRGL
jgi:hypothetical protein